MKELTITAQDGLGLSAALFEKDDPKAVIQVIHGAMEHKERYYHFCSFLNEQGYAVIVSDNRGHGASVNDRYFLGNFDDPMKIVEDQFEITKYIKGHYPGKDLYMFGHSFGSMLARIYLQEHDDEIKKLVLTGTMFPMLIAEAGTALAKWNSRKFGGSTYKGPVPAIANSGVDLWVCADPDTMQAYRNDPLVQNCKYTNDSVKGLIEADSLLKKTGAYKVKNPSLPILTANGKNDVCRGTFLGLNKTVRLLNKIGYNRVFTITYPGMRHEVINETDKASVYDDIVRFYNS
ncbi:MAG: alpha/beta fold hydrolase [Clostridia bacterium]|nr:alpha/beta fold hydrolase [Clostridia bacterium]